MRFSYQFRDKRNKKTKGFLLIEFLLSTALFLICLGAFNLYFSKLASNFNDLYIFNTNLKEAQNTFEAILSNNYVITNNSSLVVDEYAENINKVSYTVFNKNKLELLIPNNEN